MLTTGNKVDDAIIRNLFARLSIPQSPEIPLPVREQDQERVDEKYGWRDGYSDLERKTGTDWGNDAE